MSRESLITQLRIFCQMALTWILNPELRERIALQRAEQRGRVRMMEPLRRALAEADALGIQFYGKRLEEYQQVLKEVAPAFTALPPPVPTEPIPAQAQALPPSTVVTPTYVISSATLATAYVHLTRHLPNSDQEPEWMLAVTGVKFDQLYTLEQLIEVKLASQSAVTASFDMQDFARIAVTMHEQGQALHAILHSHRFNGQPQPSGVDWRLQELLDQTGYPAIQAVFSEDGYVRFFARRPFTVVVSGKGVECVDQETFLYRITHFSTLSHSGNGSLSSRPGDAIRPFYPTARR